MMPNPKKQTRFYLQPISAACLVLFVLGASSVAAAPLNLAQVPAGNSGSEPAPNVILSIDDSGSMGWDVNGCQTADWNVATYGNQHEGGAVGCGTVGTISTNPSRISSLRTALRAQFGDGTANSGLLADDRIRLAWQAMHNNGGAVGAGSLTAGNANATKRFSGTHRTNFDSFVASLRPNNGTPSHRMMSQAYDYMKSGASSNSPWASNPGTTELPYLACRRSYHIFMTDGAWNSEGTFSAGNADGLARSLPLPDVSLGLTPAPPTAYSPTNSQVRIYTDNFGGTAGSASTLSDFAFRSWAEDLQPLMDNKIKPLIKQSGNEVVTSGTNSTTLQEFWNPKNDPATWQHLTQHTIGFGRSAVSWAGSPSWNTPLNIADSTYGGEYSALVNGTVNWQNPIATAASRPSELWHAALNGRGKFYPARNDAALVAAFSDILDNILADTSKPLVSIAASGTTLKTGLYAYTAGYDGKNWSGRLSALPIDSTTGATLPTPVWNATSLLDDAGYSVAGRFVTSYNGTAGIEWKTYSSLPAAQQLPLSQNSSGMVDHTAANNYGQKRVDYIRGDRSNEQSQTGGIFRNRGSRLGDIVNSNVLFVGKPASGYGDADYTTFRSASGKGDRTRMVYVGANDGMLHGFNATNGVEKLAYIPQGIAQGSLRRLTDPNYTHRYFVDGTPFSGDAKLGATPAWKTVLVGGLAGGGKGYFALDVTDPVNFAAGSEANLVIADTTATTDPDIGHQFTTPVVDDFIAERSRQIVRLHGPTVGTAPNQRSHRWAVVLGNGYNSTNEAPVLVVQYLDGAKEIKKISPCTEPIASTACSYKTGNGLSTPQLIDLDGDGVVDIAYAGDLMGNLWKFDLTSKTDSNWKTSFTNKPFFIAKPGQSFTTAPYWMPHPKGGIMLSASTGKNLTTADQSTTSSETVYGLWDNSTFGKVPVTPATNPATFNFVITDTTPINTTSSATLPSTLVQQTISPTTFIDSGITYYTSSSNTVNYSGAAAKRGWYMNWSVQGQRVLQNSRILDGERVLIRSTVPNSSTTSSTVETCTPGTTGERSFTTVVNMFSGAPSPKVVFDLVATNITSHPDTTGMESNPAGDTVSLRTDDGLILTPPCPEGQTCLPPKKLKYGKYVGARANWREIQ